VSTDLSLIGLGKTITDVLNPTLANHGGPTKTLALVAKSPAIDAAEVGPATDQRGVNRPTDGDGNGMAKCDIGAFEYQRPDLIELGDFKAFTCNGLPLQPVMRITQDSSGEFTHITLLDHPHAQILTATSLEAVTDWSHQQLRNQFSVQSKLALE